MSAERPSSERDAGPLAVGDSESGPGRSAYQRLWAADPAGWRAAGTTWRTLLPLVERRRTELAGAGTRLSADWSGAAARAAAGRLAELSTELRGARPVLIEIDQLLAEHAVRLTRARALLTAAVAAADESGLLVDRHGRVGLDPAVPPVPGQAGHTVREVAGRIGAALELAADSDRKTAHGLSDLAATIAMGGLRAPGGGRPGASPAGGRRPPPGADPATVRRWWDGLSPTERRWLIGHQPALVGRLDGLPVAARDQANRLALAELRSALAHRRAELLAEPGRATAPALARLDRLIAGLDTVSDRLTSDAGPRGYLLALDPVGDGRAIIALGNPDHADQVITYVPGTTAGLSTIGDELVRTDLLARRCADLGPGSATAAVLWLDYDAPDFLDEAARESFARDAGPALHRFQEGLRDSHEGPPAHQTVLGYSYGSLVVGTAVRDHGLAADGLVFLGSPGVGVDHAGELGLPANRVWAATAPDDPIQYAALAPGELLERLAVGVAAPLLGPLAFGRPAEELWFGHNPADPGFGAVSSPVGSGGHGGYWAPGGPALDGLARIALAGSR